MSLNYQGSLDTNILLRYLLNDEPSHYKIVAKMFREAEGPYHVCSAVLAEVVYILEGKGFERDEVAANMGGLLSLPMLYINRAALKPALDLYSRTKLAFVDCYAAYDAEFTASPLITFDKKLASQSAGLAKLIT